MTKKRKLCKVHQLSVISYQLSVISVQSEVFIMDNSFLDQSIVVQKHKT